MEWYDIRTKGGKLALEQFVNDNMYKAHNYNELIVTSQGIDAVLDDYSHAVAFVRLGNGTVALQDYWYNETQYFPKPKETGVTFNFKGEFANYFTFQVYEIARVPVTEDEAIRINNEMTYVMTGQYNYL